MLSDQLFAIAIVILCLLIVGALWSVVLPERRVWPPPGRRSWQYWVTWLAFDVVFIVGAMLVALDWNTWRFAGGLRHLVGVPLLVIGGGLVTWAIAKVGIRVTLGLKDRLVTDGPYRFTRNPQYLGDILLFTGVAVMANSASVWVVNILLALVFLIAPITEEPWLAATYGSEYGEYRERVPRFL